MIRIALTAVVASLALACAGTVPLSEEQAMARYLELNQPLEQHGIFAVLEGSFAADVRVWAEPGAEPTDYRGLIEQRLVLGGRFLQSRFRSDMGEYGVMEGIGMMGFNSFDDRYESFWADTFSTILPPISYGEMNEDGSVLSFTNEAYDPMLDRVVRGRSVLKIQDRRRHTFEMYTETEDDGEFMSVRIVYTKL